MNQHTLKYQLLADLLATLEAEEFPIGVGKHLELQQLYSMLPEDIKPEEMKTLLAPIFAKNKQDQEFFYDVFDQSLKHIEAKTWEPKDQPITPILPPKSKSEIITRLLGLTLLLIAATLTYLRISGNQPLVMPPACEQELVVEPNSIYTLNLLDSLAKENKLRERLISDESPEFVSFLNGETVGEIPEIGTYQIDSNGLFSIKTIENFEENYESFKVTAIAKYDLGTDTTNFFIKQKEEIIEDDPEILPPTKKYSSLNLRPHPFPKILPFPKQPPLWISNFQKHKYWIKPILIFLLFAMFGAYLNWWSERQQKIIADIQSKNDPPLLWNIQIPNISKIELNEDYFKVLQLMRQRTSDDHYVLNILKTINKTIEKGGIIDFQYQHKTRPPEYLLLIDRQSSKNHRAYLYNYMFESFKANEVYIERFFFEGDIRLCWNEYYPNGIKLHDLQQTFRDARLIIVGSGYQLLNPVSGKLAKWTRVFDSWSDKAILSPRPSKKWAGREKQLKQKFILLPASVQSLTTMVDKMEAIDPEEIKTKINDEVNEPIEFRGSLIETLQHYFTIKKSGEEPDESLIHWIAACAIYPTLHWDLTMYLGQELSTIDKNLLTFDYINQLTRLPWFIEGKIPEQARLELLEYLPEEKELHLRKSLQELFETIPPPDENSVAFADSRINISLNNYLLEKNDLLKTELNQYARAGADIDVTMLKYLEGEKSPKDFVVDPNLRRYAEGKKPKVETDRWTKFLSFLVLMLTIGIIFYNPKFEECEGELIPFNDLKLCLTTPDDHLKYRAAQIRDYINHNNYEPVDSLEQEAIKKYFLFNSGKRTVAEVGKVQEEGYSIESILPFVKNDSSILHFYQNLAVDFYNHGVPSHNKYDSIKVTTNTELEMSEFYKISGDSIDFCLAFEEATIYNNKVKLNELIFDFGLILEKNCPSFSLDERKKKIAVGNSFEGGIIFYVDETGQNGLIMSQVDQTISPIEWFGETKGKAGANDTGIYGGAKNTETLIKKFPEKDHPAQLAARFEYDGYKDWYLPSRKELEKLFEFNKTLPIAQRLKKEYYWSSTEINNADVYYKSFFNGDDFLRITGNKANVRAIRRFSLNNQFPATDSPNKVLASKIGGRVFDKATNKRLENVEVIFLGKKIKTNGRGRYVHNVPVDDPSKDFDLKYVKENYIEVSKSYDRNEITVLKKDKDKEFQLDDVFLEKESTTSCFRERMEEYQKVYDSGDFEIARKILEEAKRCENLGITESIEVNNEIKKVDKLLEDLLRSRNEQQNGEQGQPIRTDEKITLEIEFKNLITSNLQPGYDIDIKGIDPSEITTLRSGAQFKVEVEQGKKYTISAVYNGIEKAKKIITAKPIDGEYTQSVILEVGIPAISAEEKAWESAIRKNDIEGLESYIKKYPNGKYINTAREKITKIIPKDVVRYGDVYIITDGYQNLNLLTCGEPLGSTSSSLTYGVHTGPSKASIAQWIIMPAYNKKNGDPVMNGDKIYLQNQYQFGKNQRGFLDIVGQMEDPCSNYLHHVNTSRSKATSWTITANLGQARYIRLGKTIHFKNEVGTKGWLGTCGTSNCEKGNVAGISSKLEDGNSKTTYWKISKL